MGESAGSFWVELVGNVIVARMRGVPDGPLVRACHEGVMELAKVTDCRRIIYDALEMARPPVEVALTQQELTPELHKLSLRIALVVPNTGIAYLGRLAFSDGDHRVFYNDLSGAFAWLAASA